jgi:hypothetical protein
MIVFEIVRRKRIGFLEDVVKTEDAGVSKLESWRVGEDLEGE